MPSCMVEFCKNRTSTKSRKQEDLEKTVKITFHVLPKNNIRRQLWLKSLQLDEASISKRPVVCSLHFKNEDFECSSFSRRLLPHAIPYIIVPNDICERSIDTHMEIEDKENSSLNLNLSLDDGTTSKMQKTDKSTEMNVSYVNRGTSVSPERIFNCPKKIYQLRKLMHKMRRKHAQEVRILKQRLQRKSTKIASLKVIIWKVKKKL
ncbi:THAP domain-containing protein 2-like [Ceratina calcarata]|uniref:THAP domain-containing protein 2-like n=1 Tax=Ceratina calcarata TaxID=156304 RepID=A0AAJ7JA43_9HYME|nr:THAP domain-containing protein 2-like [Ceratina calcarata]